MIGIDAVCQFTRSSGERLLRKQRHFFIRKTVAVLETVRNGPASVTLTLTFQRSTNAARVRTIATRTPCASICIVATSVTADTASMATAEVAAQVTLATDWRQKYKYPISSSDGSAKSPKKVENLG